MADIQSVFVHNGPLDRSTLACPPLLPPSPAPQADTPTPRNPVCWISGSVGCFWGLHHGHTLVSIITLIGMLYYASWIVHQLGIFGEAFASSTVVNTLQLCRLH